MRDGEVRTDAEEAAGERPRGGKARPGLILAATLALTGLGACIDSGNREDGVLESVSCMSCHNGSAADDYAGPGLENPHPFPGAEQLACTVCHGGNGQGEDKLTTATCRRRREIGDRENLERNDPPRLLQPPHADGHRQVSADYEVERTPRTRRSTTCSSSTPGDLRVVTQGSAAAASLPLSRTPRLRERQKPCSPPASGILLRRHCTPSASKTPSARATNCTRTPPPRLELPRRSRTPISIANKPVTGAVNERASSSPCSPSAAARRPAGHPVQQRRVQRG